MPKTKVPQRRFGIEIEVCFSNRENAQELIKKHRIIKGWCIDEDWSLTDEKTNKLVGCEYRAKDSRKLYYNKDCIDQIKEVIGIIKAHNGRVNKSTGIHVHVNCKDLSNKEISNVVVSFIEQQSKILREFKPLKYRIENACQTISPDVIPCLTPRLIRKIRTDETICMKTLDDNGDEFDFLTGRHYLLNIQSLPEHGTLEFRLFNSTLDISKIKKYIQFCINFVEQHRKGV